MQQTLKERLSVDADRELEQMVRLYETGKAPVFYAGMKRHFRIAKEKPGDFVNHAPVLGISIGGTNIKLMIASMRGGVMAAHYVRTMGVPQKRTGFREFFDDLLMNDPEVRAYLAGSDRPAVGVSFPMAVIDGVPYHPTKVPMLDGVIARDFKRDAQSCDFPRNFSKYLRDTGVKPAELFLQGDGIVAHHGAVSLSDAEADGKTLLVICGTGVALGDEENYIQVGIMRLLKQDDLLYPPKYTEDREIHYAMAGKGIFGLMARAVAAAGCEPGSRLAGCDLSRFFKSSADSKLVADILRDEPSLCVEEIRELAGKEGFEEVRGIARAIMDRTCLSLANTIVAGFVKMGPAKNGRGHKLYFEGSVCLDPWVLPRVKCRVEELVANAALFERLGVPRPLQPDMEVPLRPIEAAGGSVNLKKVDLTLVGSASMIMAQTSRG